MKVAVIGLGVIGGVHARVLREQGMLYAVCDVNPERLLAYSDLPCEQDYIRLLDRLHPDAVHICTPHYLHAEMVIAALERNIHVLCEKPLCISKTEIDAVLAAEKRSSAMLGVCFQNRYNASNRFVKEYLDSKSDRKVGTAYVTWKRDAAYYASGAWRGAWATEGGGVLINQAIHTLDLMQWMLGMPGQLAASCSTLELSDTIEVEDTASIVASDGAEFTFFATNASDRDFDVQLVFRVGNEVIRLFPYEAWIGETVHRFSKETTIYGKACYGGGHALLIDDFYRCIREGRKFPIDGAEGARVLRLVLAAYESRGMKIRIEHES